MTKQAPPVPPGNRSDKGPVGATAEHAPRDTSIHKRRHVPENLAEAIDVMSKSELIPEILGEHVFEFFLRNKRAEWEEYRREVTPYERQRYLGAL